MKKIWILTAMQEEAHHICSHYDLHPSLQYPELNFFENEEIVLACSGVGKIQASIATTLLCTHYSPDRLINIGIAGSLLGEDVKIGQVFFINKVSQHDLYLPFEGSHLNYAKAPILLDTTNHVNFLEKNWSREQGYCLTGDQFIDNEEKVIQLRQTTQAHIIEMEAFAFASVARSFWKLNTTFIIKSISDGANNAAKDAHMHNLDFAMQENIKALNSLIEYIKHQKS